MGRTVPMPRKDAQPEGLALITKLTESYAKHRRTLANKVTLLEAEIESLKRRRMDAIKDAAAVAKDARADLLAAIEANRDVFVKPKTRTLFGIKVGFRKLIGTLSWDNADNVVKLIEEKFPDQADVLIKIEKTPVKKALEQLAAADLKKLGVSVGEDTDEPVIKPTDSDVEKIVDALLKDSDESA